LIEYTLYSQAGVENKGYCQLIGPGAATGHVRRHLDRQQGKF
jgi:hypothetical protein